MVSDVIITPGRVATVTINRPPDNYFDTALIASLADAYESLEADGRCRAIVLTSAGKHFCAGAALGRPSQEGSLNASLYDEAARLFAAGLPVVAAVRGAAIGGGLGLALSADFRVGSPATRMSANFARLGFHHGFALTVTLPAITGQQQALELLMTGRRIDGAAAFAMGLLDRLVDDDPEAAAVAFATEIAGSAPLAVASIRRTMRQGLVDRVRAATAHEKEEQDRLTRTADFAEGVRAMASRSDPAFEGR